MVIYVNRNATDRFNKAFANVDLKIIPTYSLKDVIMEGNNFRQIQHEKKKQPRMKYITLHPKHALVFNKYLEQKKQSSSKSK